MLLWHSFHKRLLVTKQGFLWCTFWYWPNWIIWIIKHQHHNRKSLVWTQDFLHMLFYTSVLNASVFLLHLVKLCYGWFWSINFLKQKCPKLMRHCMFRFNCDYERLFLGNGGLLMLIRSKRLLYWSSELNGQLGRNLCGNLTNLLHQKPPLLQKLFWSRLRISRWNKPRLRKFKNFEYL